MQAKKSESPFRLRLRRFRRLKRGYYSFLVLFGAYFMSFLLPFLMSHRAIIVRYEGAIYAPAFTNYWFDTFDLGSETVYQASAFGQTTDLRGRAVFGEANYRDLAVQFEQQGSDNFVVMTPVPYGPYENFLDIKGSPPFSPSKDHWLGTDNSGRDLGVRLAYGYRISISFALLVTSVAYVFGILTGAFLGFYGRWVDILGQRIVEIWGAIPFLYTVIIIAAVYGPSFNQLAIILATFSWMGITYYIRGEFYREKAKDYVAAAVATGESNFVIMVKHILPNALTPVIAFAPFAIVATITALVSLDFLGFGLPAPTPSWGEMLSQAKQDLKVWHLSIFPLGAMFITLQLIVFIGEAVREAFDPKVYSRLR